MPFYIVISHELSKDLTESQPIYFSAASHAVFLISNLSEVHQLAQYCCFFFFDKY